MTLRFDSDLRQKAERSAKEHHRSLAEELRYALRSYYRHAAGGVSLATLEKRMRRHEREYHGLQATDIHEAFSKSDAKEESHAKKDGASPNIVAEEERLKITIEVLKKLQDLLKDGLTATPKELENALGGKISSRLIGRLLSEQGISAKNTRIVNRSARYFLPSMRPDISEKLDRLEE